jgi:major membrane immunogen (membrane-anchored lipoprotein)
MDNELMEDKSSSKDVESVVKITRKEFEDGSSEEIRVEQVDGGFIKTICKKYKDKEGYWQWDEEKSVSTEDPMKDMSSGGIAERLESVLKGLI